MIKRIIILFVILISEIVTNITILAQDTIRVSDLGLLPGTRENAVRYVQKALSACRPGVATVVLFKTGRYDFWPQYAVEKLYYESNTDVIPLRRCAILIEKMKDITIDCMGSDFIFHDRIQPFTVDSSTNITIKNVNIDWDIPLTAQAEIYTVTPEYIDLAINVMESPFEIENGKLVFSGEGWKSAWNGVMEFERDTKLIVPQTGDRGCLGSGWHNYHAEELPNGMVRVYYRFKRLPAKGNYLVLRHSARDHAGTFITGSSKVNILNMNMYHNAGLGILSQYSSDLNFVNVAFVPNISKGRILSGHDDGFHFSNCSGQIVIDRCRFQALMDDPVNVHGTSVKVLEINDKRSLVCAFMHEQSIGFNWAAGGDRIGFIENESMATIAEGNAATFRRLSPERFEITFSSDIPATLEAGDALENLTQTPDVLIRNSFFGSNRARGILVSTPGSVLIENNVFESSGSAILIPGDANGWYESGAVKNVVLKNNIFRDPCLTSMYQFCEGIISIYPEIPKPDRDKPFHRNIRIEGNEFHPFDYPILYARSVKGLSFEGNRIIKSNSFVPFHERKAGFTFEYCSNISLRNNSFEGEVAGRNIVLVDTPPKELTVDSKQNLKIEK